jgi:hypothetical protein
MQVKFCLFEILPKIIVAQARSQVLAFLHAERCPRVPSRIYSCENAEVSYRPAIRASLTLGFNFPPGSGEVIFLLRRLYAIENTENQSEVPKAISSPGHYPGIRRRYTPDAY